jgi:hypothetical protein
MNELSEMTSLRLQMMMDRRSKFISTLSNIMKKISTTSPMSASAQAAADTSFLTNTSRNTCPGALTFVSTIPTVETSAVSVKPDFLMKRRRLLL